MSTPPLLPRDALPYLVGLGGEPDIRMRLFCFPYAGGSAAAYRGWRDWLPSGVELVAIDPRGDRSPAGNTDLDILASLLAEAMLPHLDRPYALFGYSMGALLAFEVAQRLQQTGERTPSLFCVAACRPPHEHRQRWSSMSREDLLVFLQATDPRFAAGSAATGLLETNLERTRADLIGCECYVCHHREVLDCPMTVFCADQDPLAEPERMQSWRRHTRASCVQHRLSGGHFFLHGEARERLHVLVRREIAGILRGLDKQPSGSARNAALSI